VEKENSMLKFINARLYTYNFGAISVAIFPAIGILLISKSYFNSTRGVETTTLWLQRLTV
jgi:hypothetical protein